MYRILNEKVKLTSPNTYSLNNNTGPNIRSVSCARFILVLKIKGWHNPAGRSQLCWSCHRAAVANRRQKIIYEELYVSILYPLIREVGKCRRFSMYVITSMSQIDIHQVLISFNLYFNQLRLMTWMSLANNHLVSRLDWRLPIVSSNRPRNIYVWVSLAVMSSLWDRKVWRVSLSFAKTCVTAKQFNRVNVGSQIYPQRAIEFPLTRLLFPPKERFQMLVVNSGESKYADTQNNLSWFELTWMSTITIHHVFLWRL